MVPSPPAPETCSSSRGVETARVVAHRSIADATWRLRLECPSLASRALAGHFAMVRIDGRVDPLLGRPLAVYDTYRDAGATAPEGPPAARRYVDFVYTVHGRFTTALATLDTGAEVTVLGPLGNGWRDVPTVDHLLLVGGGIGCEDRTGVVPPNEPPGNGAVVAESHTHGLRPTVGRDGQPHTAWE